MAKKSDRSTGMADMFIQQEIEERTAAFNAAHARLERELFEAEQNLSHCDHGQSITEARNERNAIENEIRLLETTYNQEIAALKNRSK
jgi:hypothetical protein